MADQGSIPGLGRSPGEGNSYPLQYSGLENSVVYTVHGVTKSWTRLSDFHFTSLRSLGFLWWLSGKEPACNAGDMAGDTGSIPGSGRSPGEGIGYPLQYSGLENSMGCIVHGVVKSRTQLSDFHFQTLIIHKSLSFKLPISFTNKIYPLSK